MKKEEFFNKVYNIVKQIPEGNVMTYGQLAVILGMPQCARRVGQAMSNAPQDNGLPCHRVINSKGSLAPAVVFGEGVQEKLLKNEGVIFKENGHVDINKSIWRLKNFSALP